MRNRVRTLQTLVNGSRKITDPVRKAIISDEFDEITRSSTLYPQRRRRLLNVLHAARGLRTTEAWVGICMRWPMPGPLCSHPSYGQDPNGLSMRLEAEEEDFVSDKTTRKKRKT
jgi:hypothetical protein